MNDKEILVGAKEARIQDGLGELGKVMSIKTTWGYGFS